MWQSVVSSPPWYDAACIVTSMSLVIAGIVLLARNRWIAGMVLLFSGITSVMHRSCRYLLGVTLTPLFALDLLFALLAGWVIRHLVDEVDDTIPTCAQYAVMLCMIASWCLSATKVTTYVLHIIAHVIGAWVVLHVVGNRGCA